MEDAVHNLSVQTDSCHANACMSFASAARHVLHVWLVPSRSACRPAALTSNSGSILGLARQSNSPPEMTTTAAKSTGCLHYHFFIYAQLLNPHSSLKEIGDKIIQRLYYSAALNHRITNLRCESYPDVPKSEATKETIKKEVPSCARTRYLTGM